MNPFLSWVSVPYVLIVPKGISLTIRTIMRTSVYCLCRHCPKFLQYLILTVTLCGSSTIIPILEENKLTG